MGRGTWEGHVRDAYEGVGTSGNSPLRGPGESACGQILRFMGDPQLHGTRDHVFGSYIVQKGLAVPELRDEILAQLANQVWRNPSSHNAERGWLLLAACLSGFAPSPRLDKYLLK